MASWYRPPVDGHLPVSKNGNVLLNSLEKFDNLFREHLDKIKNINKGSKPPLVHILGDFNFRNIVWPDRLNKSGSSLSQTEGQIFFRKTCPCNIYPLIPHFYIAKLGYAGVYLYLLFLLQNIDCGYSLKPPRRGGSNVYPQSMF